ncbi:hypothetical protein BV898_10968 [Hypsibius exemplaris]|uniref:Chromo domain-containing protein n=1 Tax=Hypsibius exemplaris TaxID=2072580 RepID=A0A1W0WI09_HYPEX|nr:hypothetical protein BV898_10968 [Hypsibius exemplaris]
MAKGEYEVEAIVDHRDITTTKKGTAAGTHRIYRVKWRNYPASANTWEKAENLTNCRAILSAYLKRRGLDQEQSNGGSRPIVFRKVVTSPRKSPAATTPKKKSTGIVKKKSLHVRKPTTAVVAATKTATKGVRDILKPAPRNLRKGSSRTVAPEVDPPRKMEKSKLPKLSADTKVGKKHVVAMPAQREKILRDASVSTITMVGGQIFRLTPVIGRKGKEVEVIVPIPVKRPPKKPAIVAAAAYATRGGAGKGRATGEKKVEAKKAAVSRTLSGIGHTPVKVKQQQPARVTRRSRR